MANDWVEVQLQDVVSKLGDGLHGTPKYSEDGEYYFINGNNLENGQIVFKEKTKRVDHTQYLKYKKELSERTLLVSINGTIGNVAYYNGEKVVLGKSACYFNLKDDIDKGYVRYVLSGHYFQSYLNAFATGTTIKNVSLKSMREFSFPIPPLSEQKAIAHILGSLDDKIELNRQMNETLEAMAQALFKSWFVDFDPVIDNALAVGNAIPDEFAERAEQRKGIEKKDHSDIQSLFPDAFEFTKEMGWIPKGWEINTLEDLAVISSSKRIFAKEYKTEGIPFFRGKEISLLSKGDNFTSDIFISKERFFELKDKFGAPSAGDLLLTSVGTIGNVYLVQEGDEFYFKDGNLTWFSQYKTEIKGGYLSTWFKTRQAYLAIENIKIGSTQQAITISSLNGIKIIKPENNIISLFNDFSENAVKKIALLNKERQTLSSLRDTLLPKLMSGELRIADAAALVDEAL